MSKNGSDSPEYKFFVCRVHTFSGEVFSTSSQLVPHSPGPGQVRAGPARAESLLNVPSSHFGRQAYKPKNIGAINALVAWGLAVSQGLTLYNWLRAPFNSIALMI